jgi:Tfp pilus assembly protein PilO
MTSKRVQCGTVAKVPKIIHLTSLDTSKPSEETSALLFSCWHCALKFEDREKRLLHVKDVHDKDGLAYSEFGPK